MPTSTLERELLVLRAIDGVSHVTESPKGRFDAKNLNNNYVRCYVTLPDGSNHLVMQKCKFCNHLS